MKSVENTRRELFEDTFKKKSIAISLEKAVDLEGDCIYVDDWAQLAWIGFNAALDSVEIELPQAISEFNTNSDGYINPVAVEYDECIQDCKHAIERTNLGIKVK